MTVYRSYSRRRRCIHSTSSCGAPQVRTAFQRCAAGLGMGVAGPVAMFGGLAAILLAKLDASQKCCSQPSCVAPPPSATQIGWGVGIAVGGAVMTAVGWTLFAVNHTLGVGLDDEGR